MKTSTKIVLIAAPIAILAFLAVPGGPLGSFWQPAHDMPMPAGFQVQAALFLRVVNSTALGLGIAFLFFGYPLMRSIASVSKGLARAAHLSTAWLLVNWWPHDNLHTYVGVSNQDALLAILLVFHATVIICGLILIRYFLASVKTQQKVLA